MFGNADFEQVRAPLECHNSLNRLECFSVLSGFVTFPPARMFYYGLLQFITVSKILLRSIVPVS